MTHQQLLESWRAHSHRAARLPLLSNASIVAISLPVATLAWTEPDDPLAGTEKAGQASRLPAS